MTGNRRTLLNMTEWIEGENNHKPYSNESNVSDDVIDLANIIMHGRRKQAVDYLALNDAIFGDTLDSDIEDCGNTQKKRKNSTKRTNDNEINKKRSHHNENNICSEFHEVSKKLAVVREFHSLNKRPSLTEFGASKGISKSTLSKWLSTYSFGLFDDSMNKEDADIEIELLQKRIDRLQEKQKGRTLI